MFVEETFSQSGHTDMPISNVIINHVMSCMSNTMLKDAEIPF